MRLASDPLVPLCSSSQLGSEKVVACLKNKRRLVCHLGYCVCASVVGRLVVGC